MKHEHRVELEVRARDTSPRVARRHARVLAMVVKVAQVVVLEALQLRGQSMDDERQCTEAIT